MPARRAVIAHGLYWIAFLLPGWAGRKALAAPHGNMHANEALPGDQRRQSNAEMEWGVERVKADADVHAPPMPGRRIVDHGAQAPKEIQSTTISRFSWEENGRTAFEITRKETHAAASELHSDTGNVCAASAPRHDHQPHDRSGLFNDAVAFEAKARIRQLDVLRDFLAQKLKARQL